MTDVGVCFVHIGSGIRGKESHACCVIQSGGESKSGLKPPGSPDNWRCIAVDRLQKVKPAPGVWRTAPNHSRPQTCVFKVDVDADDHISVEEIDRKDIG